MEFEKMLRDRREKLGLGVRACARATEKSYVPFPIKSAIYISRLENKVEEEQRADAVSIDKLWALGVALEMQPMILFAYSRSMPDLVDQINSFALRECDAVAFNVFLKARRLAFDLTLREVESKISSLSPWGMSAGYLSQLETNDQDLAERISAEKLWALGRMYDVDPLLMYVLSRRVEPRFLKASSRDRLFS